MRASNPPSGILVSVTSLAVKPMCNYGMLSFIIIIVLLLKASIKIEIISDLLLTLRYS